MGCMRAEAAEPLPVEVKVSLHIGDLEGQLRLDCSVLSITDCVFDLDEPLLRIGVAEVLCVGIVRVNFR